jgi:hypothetical protein
MKLSLIAWIVAMFVCSITSWWYYSRSEIPQTEATISWDVSGYYMYLPAFVIYKDAKKVAFLPEIYKKYNPSSEGQQGYFDTNGNYVFKYSCGLALQFLPFFLVAHWVAEPLGYAADGFSWPYQFAIHFGSFFMLLLGTWLLRKLLLRYFEDKVVATTLLLVVIGSNYLNVCAVDGAMSHNWLFTWYVGLLLLCDRFWIRPTVVKGFGIGAIVGLLALTRPTELLAAVIPLLWAWPGLKERLRLIGQAKWAVLAAVASCMLVLFIQPLYWHYATGEWIVYSYQDAGFKFLDPPFMDFNWGATAGWLRYSPVWFLAFPGMWLLFKWKNANRWAILVFAAIAWYLISSWSFSYIGGRAMVQNYPMLAFGLASTIAWLYQRKWTSILLISLGLLFIYLNLCLTHQQHKGGIISSEMNSKQYHWATLGRWSISEETKKLQDTKYIFEGERKNVTLLASKSFAGSDSCVAYFPDSSHCVDWVNGKIPYSKEIVFALPKNQNHKWIRAGADFTMPEVEYNLWLMPQLYLVFTENGTPDVNSAIRIARFLQPNQTRHLYIDLPVPKGVDGCKAYLWNPSTDHKVTYIDNWKIEGYE